MQTTNLRLLKWHQMAGYPLDRQKSILQPNLFNPG